MKIFLPLFIFSCFLSAAPVQGQDDLERARVLWSEGRIYPAQQELLSYLSRDSAHLEANLLQAYLEFWTGRLPAARKRIERIRSINPGYTPAAGLLSEINAVSKPWASLQTGYLADDQPLSALRTKVEAGQYVSWLFDPTFRFEYSHFRHEGEALPIFRVRLSDQVLLARTKTRLEVSAGLLAPLTGGNTSKGFGGIVLSQTLPLHLTLDAGIEQRPYLYTLRSIQTPFTETFTQAALRFDHGGNWLGKAAWERQGFSDGNAVTTKYAWFLAPLLNRRGLKVQAGYAYSHANAKESSFLPTQAYDPNLPDTTFIPGIYDPYFTPANQEVHSVLAAVQYATKNNWRFSAKVNASILAKADIPYFYPDFAAFDLIVFYRGFERSKYSPLEITGEVQRGIGQHTSISATYTYQHLLFYTLHYGGVQIKHQFLK
jgi:hypothetical protein